MHTLSPYGIKMYDKVDEKMSYPKLGKLIGGKVDAFSLLKTWIEKQQKRNIIVDEKAQTSLLFKDDFVFDIANRRIYGWICTGDFGQANSILNVYDGSKAYDKKEDNAEYIPHFVYIYLPASKPEGLVLLHSVRGSGIKSAFLTALNKECRVLYDRVFQMQPLSYQKALVEWQKAVAKEIMAIPKAQHSDLADKVKQISPKAQTIMTIKAPRTGNFGSWGAFSKKDTEQYALLQIIEQDYENIVATVKKGDRTRKVRIGTNITDKICTIEAPEDLKMTGGNPNTDSILEWCEEIKSDFLT